MLCLCAPTQKNVEEDTLKDFAQLMRKKEFESPQIQVTDSFTEKLKHYVGLLNSVTICEDTYHAYYGQIRKIIGSFIQFYNHSMDVLIKKADHFTNIVQRDDLIILIDKTIAGHQVKQVEFGKTFQPVETPWEKRVYEEIEKLYEEFMIKLMAIKEVVYSRLDRQSKVEEFAKQHFSITVRKTSEIFDITHLYMAKMLSERMPQIRTSLEQILQRLRNNLNEMEEERDAVIHTLLSQLYEKNKESMAVSRSAKKNSIAQAEVDCTIEGIRTRIEHYQANSSARRLQTEVAHWTTKLNDFNVIMNNLTSLRKQQEETVKQQKATQFLQCQNNPECQQECAKAFPNVYFERMEELNKRIIHETRALMTFFAVKGSSRVLYQDGTGQYYLDEYKHQVYVFEDGYQHCHRDCYGQLKPEAPEEKYLYDKNGRYVIKDGEKLYQLASCTSHYKLNEQNYFEKVTRDCGHSETGNKACRMPIRDPKDFAILPDFVPIDISKSLPADTVRYLWGAFGSTLPQALCDVARAAPRNPIHYLAHKLLHHKYRRTKSELEQEKKTAEEYRANIFKERREKAVLASKRWKSRQVQRRKPEESDDAPARSYEEARLAQEIFMEEINRQLGN